MPSRSPRRLTSAAEPAPDRWDVWFWRIMQVIGALVIVSEYLVREYMLGREARFEAVGIGLSLTLGAKGVEKILTAWRAK